MWGEEKQKMKVGWGEGGGLMIRLQKQDAAPAETPAPTDPLHHHDQSLTTDLR